MNNNKIFTAVVCFFVLAFSIQTLNAQTEKAKLTEIDLKLNNDKTVKISGLKGKVVLLDFWYRGCYPCLKAIPDLIKLQEKFKDDLVIIGINDIDDQEDVTDYFEYKGVNYFSTYKTDKNISKSLKITTNPTVMLYDKQGKLIHRDTGYSKKGMNTLKKAIKNAVKS